MKILLGFFDLHFGTNNIVEIKLFLLLGTSYLHSYWTIQLRRSLKNLQIK